MFLKQDSRCTYNVTLRRVRATIVAEEKQCYCICWVCVCSLRYLMQCACAILSSVACPSPQYFPTLSHKRRDFRIKVTGHKMCVLIFSTALVRNISHSKKNWRRFDQECVLVFMWSISCSCQILMGNEFSWRIFEKDPKIISCGQMDRHTWRS
jgi:hypothetical protein